MARISGNRRDPTPQPTSNWFTQNNLAPSADQTAQPTNRTQPVGPGVPYGNDARAIPAPIGGGQLSPDDVLAFLSQYGTDYASVQAADAAGRQRYGSAWPQLLDHPSKLDKWQFSNGQVYDLVNASGSPSASWVTRAAPEAPGGHGGGGGGAMPGGGGGGSTAPGAYAGASPGYEFRMREGLRALQNSAASRGTLLTGGTLKDITRFGQDYASGEFQNDFARNLSLAQLGFNAANAAAQYGSAYGNQAGNLASNQGAMQADLITGAGNAGAAGTIGAANANRQTLGDIAGTVSQIPWWVQMARQRSPAVQAPVPTTTWQPPLAPYPAG